MAFPSTQDLEAGDAIAAALIGGWSRAFGLGYNPSVSIATVPQDAWGSSALYPWLAAATTLQARGGTNDVANTGTGAWTLFVSGLDAAFAVKTITVSLNGVTPVTLGAGWFRINSIRVLTAGTTRTNVADIIVEDTGAVLRGIVLAGKGVARQAPFTVPAGFTLHVKQILLNVESTTGAINRYARIESYFAGPVPAAAILPLVLGNTNGAPYNHLSDPPITVAEKNDFAPRITLVSDNASIVEVGWNGILRRN